MIEEGKDRGKERWQRESADSRGVWGGTLTLTKGKSGRARMEGQRIWEVISGDKNRTHFFLKTEAVEG